MELCYQQYLYQFDNAPVVTGSIARHIEGIARMAEKNIVVAGARENIAVLEVLSQRLMQRSE